MIETSGAGAKPYTPAIPGTTIAEGAEKSRLATIVGECKLGGLVGFDHTSWECVPYCGDPFEKGRFLEKNGLLSTFEFQPAGAWYPYHCGRDCKSRNEDWLEGMESTPYGALVCSALKQLEPKRAKGEAHADSSLSTAKLVCNADSHWEVYVQVSQAVDHHVGDLSGPGAISKDKLLNMCGGQFQVWNHLKQEDVGDDEAFHGGCLTRDGAKLKESKCSPSDPNQRFAFPQGYMDKKKQTYNRIASAVVGKDGFQCVTLNAKEDSAKAQRRKVTYDQFIKSDQSLTMEKCGVYNDKRDEYACKYEEGKDQKACQFFAFDFDAEPEEEMGVIYPDMRADFPAEGSLEARPHIAAPQGFKMKDKVYELPKVSVNYKNHDNMYGHLKWYKIA